MVEVAAAYAAGGGAGQAADRLRDA